MTEGHAFCSVVPWGWADAPPSWSTQTSLRGPAGAGRRSRGGSLAEEKYSIRVEIGAPVELVWDYLSRPAMSARVLPPWEKVHIAEAPAALVVGSRVVASPLKSPDTRRVLERTHVEPLKGYVEERRSGPFPSWRKTRTLTADGKGGTVVEDTFEYEPPPGGNRAAVQERVRAAVGWRHGVLKRDCELRHADTSPRLTIAVTGASGLVGTALVPFLEAQGHIVRAVRRGADGRPDAAALAGATGVVHLAGASIAEGRWSEARKRELVESRVGNTRHLVAALAASGAPPAVLVSGSAIGVFGDRGDEVLPEGAPAGARGATGAGFLAGLCLDWEAEALAAEKLGSRVTLLRTGLVLTPRGGILGKLLPVYRLGAGGPTGAGSAWMSWVSMEDELRAIALALSRGTIRGPLNAVSPNPVTGLEFAHALGRALSRPAILPLPEFALRLMFGEMAEGTMLASQRVSPGVLVREQLPFAHPTLDGALAALLGVAAG